MVKENKHLAVRWSFQTASGKVQHRRDLFAAQVEPFDDLFYAGPRFEILENRSDRHPCIPEESELVWMTLGLSAKFFPRARAPLADEACDLLTDLVCDVYFV